MRFSAYLLFSAGWLIFVYVPLAHWVWGGGFLGTAGLLDFAGGTVVHLSAGIAGLVAALVLGRRQGYGSDNLSPYDLSLAVIGTGLLWVGWFGFNGGSALGANSRAVWRSRRRISPPAPARLTWAAIEWAIAPQAVGARHDLRRGRRPRHDHAGLGLCRAMARHRHRRHRRRAVFLGLHQPEAAA